MLTLAERMFSQKVGTGAAVSFVPIAERRTGLSLPPAASAVPLRKKIRVCSKLFAARRRASPRFEPRNLLATTPQLFSPPQRRPDPCSIPIIPIG
jgi:hypothetical protein